MFLSIDCLVLPSLLKDFFTGEPDLGTAPEAPESGEAKNRPDFEGLEKHSRQK